MSLHPASIFVFTPGQERPPATGTGASHFLRLILIPPPHVALHSDSAPQGPQFPFTVMKRMIVREIRR